MNFMFRIKDSEDDAMQNWAYYLEDDKYLVSSGGGEQKNRRHDGMTARRMSSSPGGPGGGGTCTSSSVSRLHQDLMMQVMEAAEPLGTTKKQTAAAPGFWIFGRASGRAGDWLVGLFDQDQEQAESRGRAVLRLP